MAFVKSRSVVILATSQRTRGGIAAVINSYQQAGLFAKWPTIHIATHADGAFCHKLCFALGAFLRFAWLVFSRQVLLVHVHAASNASFWRKSGFIVLSFVARRPVIFHLHGGGFIEFYDRRRGVIRRWWIRRVLDHVAEIVVLTEDWRRRIRRITTNDNISVIANPVAIRPVTSARRRDNVVLFLGRLEKDKGIFEVIDAIPMVRRACPKARFWFAGEGDRDALELRARENHVGKAVELFGWVHGEAKERLLREATIYVLPSHVEGLPMAILEAMAVALPIVATDVGGIPSVIEDQINGLLVRPGDTNGLARAICRLLADPTLRLKMGAASRETINAHFRPERVLPQVEALYKKLAGAYDPSGKLRIVG